MGSLFSRDYPQRELPSALYEPRLPAQKFFDEAAKPNSAKWRDYSGNRTATHQPLNTRNQRTNGEECARNPRSQARQNMWQAQAFPQQPTPEQSWPPPATAGFAWGSPGCDAFPAPLAFGTCIGQTHATPNARRRPREDETLAETKRPRVFDQLALNRTSPRVVDDVSHVGSCDII